MHRRVAPVHDWTMKIGLSIGDFTWPSGPAELGIGAAWNEAESGGLGIPFPPISERFERLEETLKICLAMWDGKRGTEKPLDGKHYRLERPLNVPQSLSRPHPPILIGGG